MTITIPTWLLWFLAGAIGVPVILYIGYMLVIYIIFWRAFK